MQTFRVNRDFQCGKTDGRLTIMPDKAREQVTIHEEALKEQLAASPERITV